MSVKDLPYKRKNRKKKEIQVKRIRKIGGKSIGINYYYAHSYCSYERGSNENNNKLIRRFITKGTSIDNMSEKEILKIEKWINSYPRKMFTGKSSNDIYYGR